MRDCGKTSIHKCGTAETECEEMSRAETHMPRTEDLRTILAECRDVSQAENHECGTAELKNATECGEIGQVRDCRTAELRNSVAKCADISQEEKPQSGPAELRNLQSVAQVTFANDDAKIRKRKCLDNEIRCKKYLKICVDGKVFRMCKENCVTSVPNRFCDNYNVDGDVSHDDRGGEMVGLKTVDLFRIKSENIEMVARDDDSHAKSERNDMSSDFEMSRCQDDSGVVEKAHTVDSDIGNTEVTGDD